MYILVTSENGFAKMFEVDKHVFNIDQGKRAAFRYVFKRPEKNDEELKAHTNVFHRIQKLDDQVVSVLLSHLKPE